jgi:hypothetical protein
MHEKIYKTKYMGKHYKNKIMCNITKRREVQLEVTF